MESTRPLRTNTEENRRRQPIYIINVATKILPLVMMMTMLSMSVWHFTYIQRIVTSLSFGPDDTIIDGEELRSSENLKLEVSIIQQIEYNSECSYPFLPFSTMDSKPSEKRKELWKNKTHLSSKEIDDSKIISNPLFYPGLSLRQRQEQSRLLGVLYNFLVQHNIVAVAHGGIVLGALRHHGFIPWDSDIDFHIDLRDKKRFDDLVKSDAAHLAREGVGVHTNANMRIWTSSKFKPTNKKEIVQVVPMIELMFTDPSTHKSPHKKCPTPFVLRPLYTEGEVPFWTCDEEIKKWTKAIGTNACLASWNQPNRDDYLCGKHMFKNRTTIPSKIEITDQLMVLRDQKLNPGSLKRKCHSMEAYYNFVDHESNATTYDSNMISQTNIVNQLIHKQKWTCFTQNLSKVEWTPSELQFVALEESSSVLKRNHTVLSVRHTIVLEPTLCELHVTTRKTEDDTVWAKVMGLFCPAQYQWCKVDGEKRQWTQLHSQQQQNYSNELLGGGAVSHGEGGVVSEHESSTRQRLTTGIATTTDNTSTSSSPSSKGKSCSDNDKKETMNDEEIGRTATVLAMATEYRLLDYQKFVGSLRKTGYAGNIILVVSPIIDKKIEDYLLSKDVIIRKAKYIPCSHPVTPEMVGKDLSNIKDSHDRELVTCLDPYPSLKQRWARFPLLRDYLIECGGHAQPEVQCGGPVLITDMRDTIFQRNPFGLEAPRVHGLQVFEEFRHRTTHWLVDFPVGNCKGVHYDEPMLCSGATIGTRQAMLDYLEIMHTEMNTWMNSTTCCCFDIKGDDQSMHNYLYYSSALDTVTGGVEAMVNRMGLVHTVGAQASLLLNANIEAKTHYHIAKGETKDGARSKAHGDAFDLSIEETENESYDKNQRTNWLGLHYGMTDQEGYFVDLGHVGQHSSNSHSHRSFVVQQYIRFGSNYGNWIEKNKDQLYV